MYFLLNETNKNVTTIFWYIYIYKTQWIKSQTKKIKQKSRLKKWSLILLLNILQVVEKNRNKNDGKQNKHTKQSEEVETKREYQMSEMF